MSEDDDQLPNGLATRTPANSAEEKLLNSVLDLGENSAEPLVTAG